VRRVDRKQAVEAVAEATCVEKRPKCLGQLGHCVPVQVFCVRSEKASGGLSAFSSSLRISDGPCCGRPAPGGPDMAVEDFWACCAHDRQRPDHGGRRSGARGEYQGTCCLESCRPRARAPAARKASTWRGASSFQSRHVASAPQPCFSPRSLAHV